MAIMNKLSNQITLHPSWLTYLASEFELPYMQQLEDFLVEQKQNGKVIFPPAELIFNALNATPLDQVKVVILGQDPYHGQGQAHGLCFSVPAGVRLPPSLKNIFKELQRDLALSIPTEGCLLRWAEQGVLLLNAILTVGQASAGSHQKHGWEQFTDRVIEHVSDQCDGVAFLLWGNYAQKKGQLVDSNKHLLLSSPHPSPLSAHRGFIGNGHFSAANDYLEKQGKTPIDWQLL